MRPRCSVSVLSSRAGAPLIFDPSGSRAGAKMPDVAVLDNPVWHALSGPQATVAERNGGALRFDPELAPFAALADDATQADWDAMRALVGPGGLAVVVRDSIDPPTDWEIVFAAGGGQMVWEGALGAGRGSRSPEVEVLTV